MLVIKYDVLKCSNLNEVFFYIFVCGKPIAFDQMALVTSVHSLWFDFINNPVKCITWTSTFVINSVLAYQMPKSFSVACFPPIIYTRSRQDVTWLWDKESSTNQHVPHSQTPKRHIYKILSHVNTPQWKGHWILLMSVWKCTTHWSPQGFFLRWLLPNSPVMGGKEGGRWRAVERVTSPTGLCLPAGWAPWSEPTGRSGASCDGILLATVV